MKNILILAGLLAAISAGAQTAEEIKVIQSKSNIPKLTALSDSFNSSYAANHALALQFAKNNGWALTQENPDGSISMLYGITPDHQPLYAQTLNRGAGITVRANKLYSGGGLGLSIHGESMTAGLWDAPDVSLTHEAFENRAVKIDAYSGSPIINHPTHVAGTLIASDQFQSGNIRGMAFKGNLHAYDWYDDLGEAATAAASGLLLSNHSYTTGTFYPYFGIYLPNTASWDQIMYNAPYYMAIFATGNGGPYIDRITNEAAVKNGMSVAWTFQVDNYTGPSSVVISNASSRGPARDGRIKPDISAKGEAVLSTNNNTNNSSYNYGWGTSMAAPGVTGTLLLLQQYYTSLNSPNFMKAATLKALAIHTADETGTDPGPDITFGWGLLNAEKAALVIGSASQNGGITEQTLQNGGTYVKTVTASGTEPLVVTICWTDVPGVPIDYSDHLNATPRLVNDLDIRVSSGGNTYYPWKLDLTNFSGPALQGDNDRDNVEKIEIPAPVPGQTYTITITHKGLLDITTGLGKQDFSLIISGQENCPSNVIISGNYAAALTNSSNWIKSSGQTTISDMVSVKLDADANGYVEMAPADAAEFFYAAPTGGEFIAQALDGCGIQQPSLQSQIGAPVRPVKYFKPSQVNRQAYAKNNFSVYPNPAHGSFLLSADDEIKNSQIRVLDVSGKVQQIEIENLDNFNKKIRITNQAKGIYFIQFISNEMMQTRKLILY